MFSDRFSNLIIPALTFRFPEVPARNDFNKLFRTKQPEIRAEAVEAYIC